MGSATRQASPQNSSIGRPSAYPRLGRLRRIGDVSGGSPFGGLCVELTELGQTAIITSKGGKVTIQKFNSPPWTFASNCAAAAGLCTVTNFADATPPGDGSDPTGMLCGR